MTDDWREVEVEVAPNDVDPLSGALWAAGAAGVEERDAGGSVRLVVAVRGADAVDAVLAVLTPRAVEVRSVVADAGLDAWREYATATLAWVTSCSSRCGCRTRPRVRRT